MIGNTCFQYDSKYNPLDLPGHENSLEVDPKACQSRCANVDGCSYFTFWGNGKPGLGNCFLSGPDATRMSDKWEAVSGPKKCEKGKLLLYPKKI